MTVRLVMLDFDGTLADSWHVFAGSINQLAARHGFRSIAPEDEARLRRLDAREVLRELRLPMWRVPAVALDLRRMVSARIGEVQPFTGVPEALGQLLQAGTALAIASSNSADNVRAVLGDDLVQRLDALECGASLFGKAQRLRRILQRTGCPPAQAAYVGDELRDAEAAREAGVAFVAVAWGYTGLDALQASRPRHVLRTPAELAGLGSPASQA